MDLSAAILSRVDAQRPFLNKATRRAIWIGRAGIGASVAVVVLAACLAWRMWPEKMDFSNQAAPLSAVVDSVGSHATTRLVSLRQSIGSAGRVEPSVLVSEIGFKAECCTSEHGPTMPTIEALSRGVVVQPMTLTPPAGRQVLTSVRYKGAGSAQSAFAASQVRPTLVSFETPVRAGTLIDEQGLDAGLGPK